MTMRTEAIQGNDRRRSVIFPMLDGAALGATAGFIGKYTLPLTKEERNSDEYIKATQTIIREKNLYNFQTEKFINSLKDKINKTPSEDEFIKMFNTVENGKVRPLKYGEAVPKVNIIKALRNLASDATQTMKFKNLCKQTSAVAEQSAMDCLRRYDMGTKGIRPLSFFLTTGAVIGAFIALIGDIMRTDVKQS